MNVLAYEEIVNQIENKRRFGNLAGVRITAQMLQLLGNPQHGMNIIHIAGTNGKGSVSAFLCEILKAAGLKTGMFTSPHLVDFRERIRADGELIPKEDVRRLGGELLAVDFGVSPTMFDYCLVMAVLYFKEQGCQAVIIETGLGGRLDSTNALGIPDVTVITKIGYDHMAVLGNSLEEIAAEKAGIIKRGTRLVIESQEESVNEVLMNAARRTAVKCCRRIELKEIRMRTFKAGKQTFSFGRYENLCMEMLGVHQYENAAAAILAAEEFFKVCGEKGIALQTEWEYCIRQGILCTKWRGRMEILRKSPFLMVDGAHNSNGVEALARSLRQMFPEERFHFVMGVMADKDYEEMIEILLPLALDFKTVTVESERALQGEELAESIRKRGIPAEHCRNLSGFLLSGKNEDDVRTIAFGSLYFVGEIEQFFPEHSGKASGQENA